MQIIKERELPAGWTVRFEYAPAGWLTQKGTPRADEWRRYYVHVTGEELRRRADQMVSVTTICDQILPKDGLPFWSERMGIRGALEAFRRGIAHTGMTVEELVDVVRAQRLGADSARDEAADRGLNVHAILEDYMTTGRAPNPADHPEGHRPFIRGLVRWLRKDDPEPIAVETLVAHPERGYAGRLDLLAKIAGRLTLVDAKTQENGAIYESAHVQCRLYKDAEERFGEHRPEAAKIVVFDGFGGFREMDLLATAELSTHALNYYRGIKPICAGCESQNRVAKQALLERAAA